MTIPPSRTDSIPRMTIPEKAILLIGSGYGALKVAEDMVQAGIPVIWVTRAQHFLKLPEGVDPVPQWPEDLNFQFRPLYLRVTRHPLVTPLTRAKVLSLEKVSEGWRVLAEQDPIYVDYDLCTGCSRCMEVCPLQEQGRLPLSRTPAYCPSRALELDKRKTSACRVECPLGINVQAYMALTAAGRFEEALEVIKEDNPLPGICSRVCHHPCEASCRRGELDHAVAIRDIKRFLSDHQADLRRTPPGRPPAVSADKGRVAIVGSGPAGLTAACFLAKAGLSVTIFEALPEAGGMLRWSIPAYRLPRHILDREIRGILAAGIELKCNTRVGREISLEKLDQKFDAIFLAVGAHRSMPLGIPGEDAGGNFSAVEMLRAHHLGLNVKIGKKVAVIGGGGPSTVLASMAHGRIAAGKIIEFLTGEPSPFADLPLRTRGVGDYAAISEDLPQEPRQKMAQRQPKVRRRDFEEVDFGLTMEQAMVEARRCLQCSACCECRSCETVCSEIGAIDHFQSSKPLEFISPGIIVANDQEMPPMHTSELPGVFRIGEFKTDLMNMMNAGSASAGQAIALAAPLGCKVEPEPMRTFNLPNEIRLGVFLCTCNSTMAPASVLGEILEMAKKGPQLVHGEMIFSACHPRGSARIAQAVNELRLSRVILASCACCPLEFQCISCNDQRNRTRIHLFDQHGLERSTFEMINLRDALSARDLSEKEMVHRAQDLFRAAFIRMHYLGPLRQGITEIGKNILILGGSQTGMSAALNLDLQGFRIRLVHRCRLPNGPPPSIPATFLKGPSPWGRNIIHIAEATIEGISGHIGDFTVKARVEGKRLRWHVDIICLTEENVLSLAIPEDLFGLKKFYRYNFAFFHTPQPGLYRVSHRTLARLNAFEAGAALAAQVARAAADAFLKDHELSPRVDPERCRGCGRCAKICPFDAVQLRQNSEGSYTAEILRYNCVGCGGCVGRCPVTALDMPYFSNQLLEEIVSGVLKGGN